MFSNYCGKRTILTRDPQCVTALFESRATANRFKSSQCGLRPTFDAEFTRSVFLFSCKRTTNGMKRFSECPGSQPLLEYGYELIEQRIVSFRKQVLAIGCELISKVRFA